MKLNKTILFVALCLMSATQIKAQMFDDWEARPSMSLEYKPGKNLSFAGTYYLYMNQNMSRYKKSVVAGEVGYKFNSWMKAGVEYRRGMSEQKNYHEMRYALTFSHDLFNRFEIKYRPMLITEFASLNKEDLANNPVEYYLSNRLTLGYDLTKTIELYLFSENYQQIEQGSFDFYRQKSALGAEFKLGSRSKLNTRFDVINKRKGKNEARIVLSCTYTLGYVKKR